MQNEKNSGAPLTHELTAGNALWASRLVREGRANLEVLVYLWGVEFAVSSQRSGAEGLEEGEGLEV